MRVLLPISLLIVLANPAFGQDDSLLRCRAVADASARLACYDALADRQKASVSAPAGRIRTLRLTKASRTETA